MSANPTQADGMKAPMVGRILLHGLGDRVVWRGKPATIVGVGDEYGHVVYDVLLDDGEHRQRWAYEDEVTVLSEYEQRNETMGVEG